MKRIIISLIVIAGAVSAMAIGGTGAFFSDAETSTGNVFAAGAIDLKVDNESYYNGNVCAENPLAGVSEPDQPYWTWQGPNAFPVPGTECSTSWELSDLDEGHLFFNFLDLKPDDEGEDTISLHVDTNDAWACMNLALTSDDDNSSTEPELEVDVQDDENDIWDGELAQNIDMVWWADDGDNVLEEGEQIITNSIETLSALAPENNPVQIALADSDENVWGGQGPIPGQETRYIGKAWCFGTLALSPVPTGQGQSPSVNPGVTCDGTLLGNETQTDGAILDVSFSAIQARHNDDFQCEVETPCEPKQAYADNVVAYDQGVRKDGSPINADRTDSNDALGAPQSLGLPFDNPVPTGEFFSLGFDEGTDSTSNEGGWITVEFTDNIVVDGLGNDLRVWEVTGGSSYPVEKVKIEVSKDGSSWFPVASSLDRDAEADLASSGLDWARYVRLTDVSNRDEFEDTADGYDLDAFSALNCALR